MMTEKENTEIVKQGLAAFQRGDIQSFLELLDDEVDFRHPMRTAIWPWAGHRHGRIQVAEFFANLQPVEEFEVREFIAQRDKVVVLLFERLRIKDTGRRVDNEFVIVFTLRDAKVVQLYVYEDTAPIIAAIRDREGI
jgi:ketosteroid isomerase-like protein